ncbi:MAG: hypothetical protein HETSPECPRED_008050 [Heterodermia speciosa]|uniref:Uncharacterized protein n=1 Tax=Heterodermia speciosa TaxID=116794 RepID=A0A8H3EQF6_9LECA|nr:MAG: hypothetical protein HETSPECPRED_008050 [Heterodermia speciosa]
MAYDGSVPRQAAAVENPDGSIDSVGLPEGTSGVDGFNVPLYLLITVSGPKVYKPRERTDYMIGMSLAK